MEDASGAAASDDADPLAVFFADAESSNFDAFFKLLADNDDELEVGDIV